MKSIIQKSGLLIAMLSGFLTVSAYDFEVGDIYYTITSMADLEVEVSSNGQFKEKKCLLLQKHNSLSRDDYYPQFC